ncbi:hypothetical protein MWU57_15505 [Isoptericola sp. S6320L]|uniref:hypothetical protein n=1 Tax=Isoptericola sp. S6320L TaxID=2926411 RepID=UPI001FF6E932|nr:hypothetical protein [Isoptericola sp. S6320L]MCK0118439.1 hypothetical protein [Isoptericola sp. S6320L]
MNELDEMRGAAARVDLPERFDPEAVAATAVRRVRTGRVVRAGGVGALALALVIGGAWWLPEQLVGPGPQVGGPGVDETTVPDEVIPAPEEPASSLPDGWTDESVGALVVGVPAGWGMVGGTDGVWAAEPEGTADGAEPSEVRMWATVGTPYWFDDERADIAELDVPGAEGAWTAENSVGMVDIYVQAPDGTQYEGFALTGDDSALLQDLLASLRIDESHLVEEQTPEPVGRLTQQDIDGLVAGVATGVPVGWNEYSVGELTFAMPPWWEPDQHIEGITFPHPVAEAEAEHGRLQVSTSEEPMGSIRSEPLPATVHEIALDGAARAYLEIRFEATGNDAYISVEVADGTWYILSFYLADAEGDLSTLTGLLESLSLDGEWPTATGEVVTDYLPPFPSVKVPEDWVEHTLGRLRFAAPPSWDEQDDGPPFWEGDALWLGGQTGQPLLEGVAGADASRWLPPTAPGASASSGGRFTADVPGADFVVVRVPDPEPGTELFTLVILVRDADSGDGYSLSVDAAALPDEDVAAIVSSLRLEP